MILYLDTSNRYRKVVRLVEDDKVVVERITDGDVLVAVAGLLDEQGVKLEELEKVEAYPGPGSFTGLRVGLSIANAINYALGKIGPKEIAVPEYGKKPNITGSSKLKVKS